MDIVRCIRQLPRTIRSHRVSFRANKLHSQKRSVLIDGTLWNHPVTKGLSEIATPVERLLSHLVHRSVPRLLWRHLGRIVAQDQSRFLTLGKARALTLIACPAWTVARRKRIAFESRALNFGLELSWRKTTKIKNFLTRFEPQKVRPGGE